MELLALSSRLLLVAVLTLYGLISVVPPGGVTQPWRQVLRGGEARFRSIVDGLRSTVDVIRPPFQSPVPWTPRIEFESLKAEAVAYFTEEPEEEPILRLYSQLDSWPAYSPKNLPPLRLVWREEMPAELPLWAIYTLIAPTVLSIILVLAWWIRSMVNPQASDSSAPLVPVASQPALSDGQVNAASTASALDEADSSADVQGAPLRVSRSRNRVVSCAITTTLLVQAAPLAYVVDAPNPLDSVLAY
ncbi:hypothetical protein BC629DRAFT_1443815 [Irpex lacteus]|nr:hypothetical protein BC629DRAFT_1443815 [Irpex lacteus]